MWPHCTCSNGAQNLVAYAKEVDVRLHSHSDDRGTYTRTHRDTHMLTAHLVCECTHMHYSGCHCVLINVLCDVLDLLVLS